MKYQSYTRFGRVTIPGDFLWVRWWFWINAHAFLGGFLGWLGLRFFSWRNLAVFLAYSVLTQTVAASIFWMRDGLHDKDLSIRRLLVYIGKLGPFLGLILVGMCYPAAASIAWLASVIPEVFSHFFLLFGLVEVAAIYHAWLIYRIRKKMVGSGALSRKSGPCSQPG